MKAKVQQIVDAGEDRFEVARMAAGDDPAFGVVKTLIVDYTAGDQSRRTSAQDPKFIELEPEASLDSRATPPV